MGRTESSCWRRCVPSHRIWRGRQASRHYRRRDVAARETTYLSETAPANIENSRDRERPKHQRGGGSFLARDSPAFPSRGILRSLNTTNKSRERNDEG